MNRVTIHWKAVEQYFTVVLFVSQFYPVWNFGKCISFGLGTVRSERVGDWLESLYPSLLTHDNHYLPPPRPHEDGSLTRALVEKKKKITPRMKVIPLFFR